MSSAADCHPFVADCGVRLATDLVAHTWDPVVLMALRTGGRRRLELLTSIGGISDKVLSQSLRRLLANGLVARRTAPPSRATTYVLTPLGESLAGGPMTALARWAVEHGDQVLAAQRRAEQLRSAQ
ncbi:MAG: winged helix-turn-helix transcriptional regulator [Conexibacter sp.]